MAIITDILNREAVLFEDSWLLSWAYQDSPAIDTTTNALITATQLAPLVHQLLGLTQDTVLFSSSQQPTSLIKMQANQFPVFTRAIGANNNILQPRIITMRMDLQGSELIGMEVLMTKARALAYIFQRYANQGGTFTVIQGSGTFRNCILQDFSDTQPSQYIAQSFMLSFMSLIVDASDLKGVSTNPAIQSLDAGGKGIV